MKEVVFRFFFFFFFKQKTAYEMSIGDWSSDVCSSDLHVNHEAEGIPSRYYEIRNRRRAELDCWCRILCDGIAIGGETERLAVHGERPGRQGERRHTDIHG